ncbi:multicopper oxidase family protein [Sinomonas sp. ASV322]|uniref:multicopper oxidase family protein n=1 Tax=Sinomonas sp. ASV322 TaxID=3041920 RepID=UPI0027DD7D32|nr:multicopper oxidase family protein [Sinomonas sp. ASV322]MDQ4503188.1 multicopper oxidase family protein [Sinomonas sp. ASV322]
MAPSAILGIDLIVAAVCAAVWIAALAAHLIGARATAPGWLPAWGCTAAAAGGFLLAAARAALLAGGPPALVGDRLLGFLALTVPGAVIGAGGLALARRPRGVARSIVPGALTAAAAMTTAGFVAVLTLGTPAGWLPLAVLAVLPVVGTACGSLAFSRGWPHRATIAVEALGVAVLAGSLAVSWMDSRAEPPSSFTATGHHAATAAAATAPRSVETLRGPAPTGRLREFTLHARTQRVTLDDGTSVDALTFGSLPGPELRATQGDTIRVTLVNDDVADGVTLHWHGYDVPNAMDGVPGVTQDAVRPGQSFTYEFPAAQAGTYWYHTHQNASVDEPKGLYGALVVIPADVPTAESAAGVADLTVPIHTIGGATLFGPHAQPWTELLPPGTAVRLRIINTDQITQRLSLAGASFRVAAVDGADLAGGAELTGTVLPLAGGGRYDVVLTMPDHPVQLALDGARSGGLTLAPPGSPSPAPRFAPGPELDLATYGAPAATAAVPPADLAVTYTLDHLIRFVDGIPRFAYTVNGAVYPNIPPLVVREGDHVLMTIVNRSDDIHPMHPHGHHVRVLSIDGQPVVADLRMDSLEVRPGHVWTVMLTADNPGIWMDHCHNLAHARDGMMFHLAYDGVTSPFGHGGAFANRPE